MSPGLLSVDDDKGLPPLSSPTVNESTLRHQELLHPILLNIAHNLPQPGTQGSRRRSPQATVQGLFSVCQK